MVFPFDKTVMISTHRDLTTNANVAYICNIPMLSVVQRDPMTKLKEWVEQAGYRLIDLLRHFDKDNSMTISRQEFVDGIKVCMDIIVFAVCLWLLLLWVTSGCA